MGELPTGTITMLFSDVEGSTALLSRLGDRYGEALSAQRAIQRAAFAEFGGHEMGTEGDSFFAVFASAADAAWSCVAAQRNLAGHNWPEGITLRVRMGLHSGEPARHEDGYIGMDVHRAARIAAAAHGGQVVASDAARLLAAPRLPADVSFHDLGFYRLKDIEAPEHVFQLTAAGLPDRFPPLRSLGAATSFPAPVTPLVGRDDELAALCATVARPGVRLVTLTGPGGVGKTRLGLAAAASLQHAFPHGSYFVPLAAVRDADVMWKTIAGSLDAPGDGPDAEVVADFLRQRRTLLVLDNLEQLDGAAAVVAELLAAAAELVILATSRRPLHVLGEHELPVPPLGVPGGGSPGEVAASGAAMLFAQQAQLVRPGFAITENNGADVAAICARLDGLPLAIELAASRAKLLTPKALLARLGDSLTLAATDTGRPQRQQTLRDTIAWSYDLLSLALAAAFRRMGVFAGGASLDALAAVAAVGLPGGGDVAESDPLELAAELQDLSLITVAEGPDGEPRVGMLETIRDYALERLAEAGELDEAQRRHAQHYAALAEWAHERYSGPQQLAALDRLEAEQANLRAALTWSLDTPAEDPAERAEQAAIGLWLARELAFFWYDRGHATEGRRWLEQATELAPDDAGAPLARAVHGLAVLLAQQGEHSRAIELLERNLALWRKLGDREQESRELNSLGATYYYLSDLGTARSLLQKSAEIGRKLRSDQRVAIALGNLGQVESDAGNLGRATEQLQESLALYRKLGDNAGAAIDIESLAVVSLRAGRPHEARDLLAGVVDYAANSGDTEFLASTLEVAACIAAALGGRPPAARLAGAAEGLRQQAGMPIPQPDAARLEQFLAPARAATAPSVWDAELATGLALSQQQAAELLRSAAARA
jgi:predicted ATPase/class 3 adenylate cyclase